SLLYGRFSVETADLGNVETADGGLYLPFDRDLIKDFSIADQGHNLGADLGLHDGKLSALRIERGLGDNRLRKPRIFQSQFLFVNNQHGYGLSGGRHLLFLLRSLLFRAFAEKI